MNSLFLIPQRTARRWMACCLSILAALALPAQSRIEYFWNTDPGVGRATRLTGEAGEMRCELPTGHLPEGANLLGIRALNGRYASSTLLKVVFKSLSLSGGGRVEYFWDHDPGMGCATPCPAVLNDEGNAVSFDLPTRVLSGGMHLLGLRAGNGSRWSPTYTRLVAVAPDGGAVDCVEYFWDDDPGQGNATRYPVSGGGSEVTVSFDVLTEGLGRGIHLLGIRSHSGGWSPTLRRAVVIGADDNPVEAVEYFWDEDPGYGQAAPLAFSGTEVAVVNEEIPAPQDYGTHVLVIRARSGGVWGTPWVQTFCMNAVPDFALPADTLCKGQPFTVKNLTRGATDETVYAWDMNGDGKTDAADKEDFTYTYPRAGEYMVRLSVKTVGDCETTCTRSVVVLDTTTPSVSLGVSATTVYEGDTVRFTATARDAGGHPQYEWLVNDEVMATGPENVWETDSLKDADRVKVRVISSNPCSQVEAVDSRELTFTVKPVYHVVTLDENSTTYPVTKDILANEVNTNRVLKAGQWNTLCLPFDLTAEQMAEAGISEAFTLSGVMIEGDMSAVNFIPVARMEAGKPYLVKAVESVTLAFENVLVRAAIPGTVTLGDVSMSGSYCLASLKDVYYISGDKFYYADVPVVFKGFRAYIVLPDAAGVKSLAVHLDDVTAINGPKYPSDELVDVYTVNGIMLKTGVKATKALDGLPRGIYIVNGEKAVK